MNLKSFKLDLEVGRVGPGGQGTQNERLRSCAGRAQPLGSRRGQRELVPKSQPGRRPMSDLRIGAKRGAAAPAPCSRGTKTVSQPSQLEASEREKGGRREGVCVRAHEAETRPAVCPLLTAHRGRSHPNGCRPVPAGSPTIPLTFTPSPPQRPERSPPPLPHATCSGPRCPG